MPLPSTTIAIDYGAKYIGLALVEHAEGAPNRVLYACTVVVDPKPLKELVKPRADTRRLRRTRKTHRRRLRRLAQSLADVPNADQILRFCGRRGFSHESDDDQDEQTFRVSRARFFQSLEEEVEQAITPEFRERVLAACSKHLNRLRQPSAELRPARFENRGRSRCNWAGCRNNVPRAGHDIQGRLQQCIFLWLQPIFRESNEPERFRKSVDHWVRELAGLAKGHRRSKASTAYRKQINARKRTIYSHVRKRVRREASEETAAQFDSNWSDYYQSNLNNVIEGKDAGRVRYCRQHSAMFVDHIMASEPIPNREDIRDSDLISRTQQIVFRRLWRLIEGRFLPLAGGRIDRVVVERVAFDILSGPIKQRQKMPEDRAAEMYWHGPQAGFDGRRDMLKAEFGNRCAYCGQEAFSEIEHVYNRSDFPFDSYFNIVPACTKCNARKGGRTAFDAGMTIHDDAYAAYCDYLKAKKVLHPYHTIKKGMLNLLRRSATSERAQQLIGMIADNLVSITATQRAPRPLGRYLATKISERTGQRPEIAFRAGRHTALYRSVILPSYDKAEAREADDLRNHAVDAIVLGCRLPSASALENRKWTTSRDDVLRWMESVKEAAPAMQDGLPAVESVVVVPHFETDAGLNYITIALSAFNWNRKRKAAHKLDPFGKTAAGIPMKRMPAATVLANLLKGEKQRDNQIDVIAHRTLRESLLANRDTAGETFVLWLQKSVRAGLTNDEMSSHPADQERRRLLGEFTAAPVSEIVAEPKGSKIPWTIGIRCLNRDTGAPRKVHVARRLGGNDRAQFYPAQAVIREIRVGYREADDQLDRNAPIIFAVNQIDELSRQVPGRWEPVDVPSESPLRGRPLASEGSRKEFRKRWEDAFADLCRKHDIAKVFRITQGCVIEKTDGAKFQIRNFDKSQPWMKGGPFKQIRRVYRSPFQAM
ncbi:MAG: RRXRR domain-containing protein [Planctomycetes bacterium]|nr:RRXRR domain-containing protein [Planctomycetota bacterium]MBL7043603.1 RRXRR domain-containing protein [Pirellulaceae bacterium]